MWETQALSGRPAALSWSCQGCVGRKVSPPYPATLQVTGDLTFRLTFRLAWLRAE